MSLDKYETKLLEGWEEVYKKGQLTMWILLALKVGPKHMAEIKAFIENMTKGTMSADDQSMYRALRRYYDAELVKFELESGENGPDRKIYSLTKTGRKVLDTFLERNVLNIFYQPKVRALIEK